jgi:hypothetical protein
VSIVGKDPEGIYRPEFVQKILRAAHQHPTRRFVSRKSFLDSLNG